MMIKGELYFHIPFCVRKCAYCDFFSGAFGIQEQKQYFQSLHRELDSLNELQKKAFVLNERPIRSIFFGGGTPSLCDPKEIGEVLSHARKIFRIEEDAEITLESNPGTLSPEKLKAYRQYGINRLSIGLQSAENRLLKVLSRIHDYDTFLENYRHAREAGFDNISVDLMSGLPSQSMTDLRNTLQKVIDLQPEHISCYSLIIEEGTPFYERYGEDRSQFPSEEEDRDMYHMTGEMLKEAGYHRYEISNYAKPGRESRHNIGYWQGNPYLGFGAAAASFIPENDFSRAIRYKHASILGYQGQPLEEKEELLKADLMAEYMFLGLRMINGVSNQEFRERFGVSMFEVYGDVIQRYERQGALLRYGEGKEKLKLTAFGLDVCNVILCEFV